MDLASDLFCLEHLSQPNMLVIVMSVGDIGQAGINVSHYRGSARRGRGRGSVATDDGNGHKIHSVSSSHHQHDRPPTPNIIAAKRFIILEPSPG